MSSVSRRDRSLGAPARRFAVTYRQLDPDQVDRTVRRLERRIEARFGPDRGLAQVTTRLGEFVATLAADAERTRTRVRRNRLLASVLVISVVAAAGVALVIALGDARQGPDRSFEWLPLIESTINDIVFAGLAVLFLWALPERVERRRRLELVHELRALAHVADMHQLAKHPEQLLDSYRATSESYSLDLDAEQLEHYLEYCSELLSLIAKSAALAAGDSNDAVVLEAVSDVESLTNGLTAQIWQKRNLLRTQDGTH